MPPPNVLRMAGDIGYSSERFGRALSYLALHEGTYRERLQEALAEAHHSVDGESGQGPAWPRESPARITLQRGN